MTPAPRIVIEFIPRDRSRSEYDWANISADGQRVGKARCQMAGTTVTIFSILIFPENAGQGLGTQFVEYCKARFRRIIADRVRPTAIGFWEAMGFHHEEGDTWVFDRSR